MIGIGLRGLLTSVPVSLGIGKVVVRSKVNKEMQEEGFGEVGKLEEGLDSTASYRVNELNGSIKQ